MIKNKNIGKLLVVPALVLSMGNAAYAQSPAVTEPNNQNNLKAEVSAGITPDNFLYFLDVFGEKLSLFFTFTPEQKIKLHTKLAKERLAEYQELKAKKEIDVKIVSETKNQIKDEVRSALDIVKEEREQGNEEIDEAAHELHEDISDIDEDIDDIDSDDADDQNDTDDENDTDTDSSDDRSLQATSSIRVEAENADSGKSFLKVEVEASDELDLND